MASRSCTLMNMPAVIHESIKEIYIPNYGPIDIKFYYRLRKLDTGMCDLIKIECSQSLTSETCHLGRALYNN